MVKIIIVEKSGELKEVNYKTDGSMDLYKMGGFKSEKGFDCEVSWELKFDNGKSYNYNVYGKKTGKANYENKYDFPPPIDNILFFNNCVITKTRKDKFYDLTLEEWLSVYEDLFGGFEDLESEEESEEEEYEGELTKEGYAKDGFIIDDEDILEIDDESYSEEECDDDEDDDSYEENEIVNVKKYNTRLAANTNTIFTSIEEQV